MKVLVLIMSGNMQPALRNEAAIFDTYVKSYNDNKDLFNHEYEFMSYRGGYSDVKLNNNILELTSPDDISGTFQKTMDAFNYIKNYEFDYLIRVNISAYINLFILDNYIETFNKDKIYCNAICTYYNSIKYKNEMFPRGDAYIIHKELFNNILNFYTDFNVYDNIDDGVDNPDDSLFGILLSNYFNHQTHNHIQLLNYSFIPQPIQYIDPYTFKLGALTIFSRLKTCPSTESHSGYSWNDNEYRLHDVVKFKSLNKYIFDVKNGNTSILFGNENDDKFTININNEIVFASFNTIKNLLNGNDN